MVQISTRLRILLVIAAAAVTAAPAVAAGNVTKLRARMDAKQVVVPRKPVGDVAHAAGTFVGTLTQRGQRWNLAWRINYAKLATPIIVIADVHRGKPKRFGPILVRLCAECHPGQSGRKVVTPEAAKAMLAGDAFITLITGKNPNGEIRGQIARG